MSLFGKKISDEELLEAAKNKELLALCGKKKIPAARLQNIKDAEGNSFFLLAALDDSLKQVKNILPENSFPDTAHLFAKNKRKQSAASAAAAYGGFDNIFNLTAENDPPTKEQLLDSDTHTKESFLHQAASFTAYTKIIGHLPEEKRPTAKDLISSKDNSGFTVLYRLCTLNDLEDIASVMPEKDRPTLEELLETKGNDGRSIYDGLKQTNRLPRMLAFLPEQEQKKLAEHMLKKKEEQLFQAPSIKAISKSSWATLSFLARLEKNAPKDQATDQTKQLINAARTQLRKKATNSLVSPKRKGREG